MTMNGGSGTTFVNPSGGSYANSGTSSLSSSMTWTQSGGSESGNPIQITGSATVADSAGAGSFEYDNPCGPGNLTGTVPAGQTIEVVGTTGGCSGNVGNYASVYLGGSTNATVINDGTIDLDAGGSGTTSGGDATVQGGELDNHGTLASSVTDSSWNAQLLVPLVNEAGANVVLSGGELAQTTGSTTVNSGTVSIGAGATWLLQSGAFANNGAVALGISSPTDLGQFSLTNGSKFTAGGTLAPALTSGYAPAAGTEFAALLYNGGSVSGTFATVTGGFTADYTKESATPGYVGVIYNGSPATTATPPATTAPAATTKAKVGAISGAKGAVHVSLTCPSGGAACARVTVKATVTEKLKAKKGRKAKTKVVTVASASASLAAGAKRALSLKLNKAGKALLKGHKSLKVTVTISAGGKVLKTTRTTVTATTTHGKKKKKK
jgi:hypothetical protein